MSVRWGVKWAAGASSFMTGSSASCDEVDAAAGQVAAVGDQAAQQRPFQLPAPFRQDAHAQLVRAAPFAAAGGDAVRRPFSSSVAQVCALRPLVKLFRRCKMPRR